MKKILSALLMFTAFSASAEYVMNDGERVRLGVGGYVRSFTGQMEHFRYNNAMKSEGYIKPYFDVNDDITLTGKIAGRWILNDRFPDQNKFKMYDVYGTIKSKTFGTLDFGDLRNVAYLMHQGPVDVGLFDIDDSDISYFYERPSGFFAPTLSYLYTDGRDLKVNYITPSFGGFKWGITAVQSDDNKPDTIADNSVKIDHGKGVITSVQYKQDFEWVNMGASAGFAYYHNDKYFFKNKEANGNHNEYSLGLRLEKNDFSVGASYRQMMFQKNLGIGDTHTWVVGTAYDGEKYGISLNYLHSDGDFNEKNTYTHLMLSGRYTINEYLKATLSIGRLTWDKKTSAKTDSWFGLAGLELEI